MSTAAVTTNPCVINFNVTLHHSHIMKIPHPHKYATADSGNLQLTAMSPGGQWTTLSMAIRRQEQLCHETNRCMIICLGAMRLPLWFLHLLGTYAGWYLRSLSCSFVSASHISVKL